MTLVADRGRDGPRVHVLAIGVGAYRHLPGGAEPVTHDTLGLRQLSGPPASARLFVEWAATRLRHPRARLGTVELLTSPGSPPGPADDGAPTHGPVAPPDPGPAPAANAGEADTEGGSAPSSSSPDVPPWLASVEVPTLAHVQTAFERWYAACDTDESNVAILYFCGHGVEREAPFLLLEDFGRSALSLLENAVDIGATYQGMARNRAREQYVFVDACREIPFQLLQMLSGNAKVLVTPQLVGDQRRDTALVFATSGGAKAYGKAGRPTRFTQALVRALDGLGARVEGAGWVVDVPTLQRAVTQQLRAGDDGAPAQLPSVRGAGLGVLTTLTDAPLVPITLACRPPTAIPGAALTLTGFSAFPGVIAGRAAPTAVASTTGWSFEAPADVYTLTVDFPGGAFPRKERRLAALPPGIYDEVVEVQP